ncbi:MAG: aspartate-semialdehyde dehydrogenase [Nitrososphaerota archaeon]
MRRVKVALLGATGMVGQNFLRMLASNPFFEVRNLVGYTSVGKKYGEAVEWIVSQNIPEEYVDKIVFESNPKKIDAEIVFSALPGNVARDIEPQFSEAGFPVISNASAYRLEKDVPLIVPEINVEHLELIKIQKRNRKWDGFIVTNPNCSTIALVLALKPIHDLLKIKRVFVTTMQAVSGAGYPGVPSLKIIDNVIPFIEQEEEKMETETLKILGKFNGEKIDYANIKISASCNRVPVIDGHMESVYVETEEKVDIEEVKEALRKFKGKPQELNLPTAPKDTIIVREEKDRPQPRMDRLSGTVPGMSIVVGRIRHGMNDKSLKFIVLGHNTIRGAAGSTILIGELMYKLGLLEV